MTNRWQRTFAVGMAAVAVVLAGIPVGPADAQAPTDAVNIRVETVDDGLRCVPDASPGCSVDEDGQFIIEVEQGRLVNLTFVWAHVGWVQEEHVMILDGYKLETESLTFANREETMVFIADKPGRFAFKCDLECEVHDFLKGELKVSAGGSGSGAAVFTPTSLSISPSSFVTLGAPVTLTLMLRDPDGQPVSKSEVSVFVDAEFGGTKAKMLVGSVKTDSNGVAFFEYEPTSNAIEHEITARFEGGGIYAESESSVVIERIGEPSVADPGTPSGIENWRGSAPAALAGATVVVWVLLGLVLLNALSLRLVRKEPEMP